MDDDNKTRELLKIFYNNIVATFGEIFKGNENITVIDRFNTSCIQDSDCMHTGMFCNLTNHLCRCAKYHIRNDNARICVYQLTNFSIPKIHEQITIVEDYSEENSLVISWSVIATMIFGAICILLCAIYACLGNKDEENEPEKVSEIVSNERLDVQ